MVEIAKCNGVGKQYVSRLIRLALLAPEMVERIAAGRQPPELTAQALGFIHIGCERQTAGRVGAVSQTACRTPFYRSTCFCHPAATPEDS